MTEYPVQPAQMIKMGGEPLWLEYRQGSGTAILPGDLVQFTAPGADCTVKAAVTDSAEVIGVAAISPAGIVTPPRGGDRVTAYAEGDSVRIMRGSVTCVLRIKTSEEIQCGEFVQPAASGEVMAFICGTDNDCQRIAQALETIDQDTTTFQWGAFALERFG